MSNTENESENIIQFLREVTAGNGLVVKARTAVGAGLLLVVAVFSFAAMKVLPDHVLYELTAEYYDEGELYE